MNPPTRTTFNPNIPFLAQMPSPPSPLRALIYRFNSTPTRRHKAAAPPYIKTEPESVTKTKTTTTIPNSSSSSSQAPSLSTQRSLSTSDTTPNSTDASTSSNTSCNNNNNNQPALSQALAIFFQSHLADPTSSDNDKAQTHFLDFENSKIEIHFHVHPILRPAFPTPVPISQKLKRKREGGGEDGDRKDNKEANEEGGNQQIVTKSDPGCDVDSGRSKKKAKLSHGFGYSFGDRKFRADAGARDVGVRTRSRTSGSRRSSMGNRR